jgi:hypothetical protein
MMWEKGSEDDARFAHTAHAPMMAKLPSITAETRRKGDPAEMVSRAIHRAFSAAERSTA